MTRTAHPTPNSYTHRGLTRGRRGCGVSDFRCRVVYLFLLFACLGGGFVPRLLAGDEPSLFRLNATASVDSEGIYLRHLVVSDAAMPEVRLGSAPAFGKFAVLNRAQLAELLRAAAPDLVCSNWAGAEVVRITRRERAFSEADLLPLLTAALQQEYVKEKGELELRLTRPWVTRNLPDEVLSVKVTELPNTGVTPSFILRFELFVEAHSGQGPTTTRESLGTWQACLQAKVWREVWVAKSAVKKGQLVVDADIARERRDVLTVRDTLADFTAGDATLELAEPLQSGTPLLARSVKLRPVIRRGQFAEARVQDGALQVSLKVEALEDGAPGQTIRARNLFSRRDLTGKVLDEQTILVSL